MFITEIYSSTPLIYCYTVLKSQHFWLALHCRLWTAERRKRHGLQDDDGCALCDQEPETQWRTQPEIRARVGCYV
jgi:hypothetical protein